MTEEQSSRQETFGERLRTLIQDRYGPRGQSAFAADIDKSPKAVSAYCGAARLPEPETLTRMSDVLGVSVDYLLKGRRAADVRLADLPPRAQQILHVVQRLTPAQQDAALAILEGIAVVSPEVCQLIVTGTQAFQRFFETPVPNRRHPPPGAESRKLGGPGAPA